MKAKIIYFSFCIVVSLFVIFPIFILNESPNVRILYGAIVGLLVAVFEDSGIKLINKILK